MIESCRGADCGTCKWYLQQGNKCTFGAIVDCARQQKREDVKMHKNNNSISGTDISDISVSSTGQVIQKDLKIKFEIFTWAKMVAWRMLELGQIAEEYKSKSWISCDGIEIYVNLYTSGINVTLSNMGQSVKAITIGRPDSISPMTIITKSSDRAEHIMQRIINALQYWADNWPGWQKMESAIGPVDPSRIKINRFEF